MVDIAEHLLDLLCDNAAQVDLVEAMRAQGVCESQQTALLADAKMSHQKMIVMEQELVSLRADHTQLQKDHAQLQKDHVQLQTEREMETTAKDNVHRALQNLAIPPPLVISHRTIGNLLLAYDLTPQADDSHFGADRIKNKALETLYDACNLKR